MEPDFALIIQVLGSHGDGNLQIQQKKAQPLPHCARDLASQLKEEVINGHLSSVQCVYVCTHHVKQGGELGPAWGRGREYKEVSVCMCACKHHVRLETDLDLLGMGMVSIERCVCMYVCAHVCACVQACKHHVRQEGELDHA